MVCFISPTQSSTIPPHIQNLHKYLSPPPQSLILHQAVEYITKLEGEKYSLVSQNTKLLKLIQHNEDGRVCKRRRDDSDNPHNDSELMGKVERLVRELKSQLDVERKKRLTCERQLDNFKAVMKNSSQLGGLLSSSLLSPSSLLMSPTSSSPSSFSSPSSSSSFIFSPPLTTANSHSSNLLVNHPIYISSLSSPQSLALHTSSLPPHHSSSSSSSLLVSALTSNTNNTNNILTAKTEVQNTWNSEIAYLKSTQIINISIIIINS